MKTFIELTDFWRPERTEYVNPSEVARIEPYDETEDFYKDETKEVTKEVTRVVRHLLFFKKDIKETVTLEETQSVLESTVSRKGSLIYMKNKGKTFVGESPEDVLAMIENSLNSKSLEIPKWSETIESKRNKKSKKGARK